MKLATYWWGVQMLAETDSDKNLLVALSNSIGQPAKPCYVAGSHELLSIADSDHGFSTEDVKEAKCILEINRW